MYILLGVVQTLGFLGRSNVLAVTSVFSLLWYQFQSCYSLSKLVFGIGLRLWILSIDNYIQSQPNHKMHPNLIIISVIRTKYQIIII